MLKDDIPMKKSFFISRILIFIMVLFIVLAGAKAAQAWRQYPVEKYQLKNGMTIILKRIPESPVVSTAVVYRVGSRNERDGIVGINHVIEQLMRQNTRQYPGNRIPHLYGRLGAEHGAFTSNDVTGFYTSLAPQYLELMLHIEASRMKNCFFTDEITDIQKKIIVNEIQEREKRPAFQLWNMVRQEMFKDHPYNYPTFGRINDINNLKLDSIKWYYNNYYQPQNAVLAVVGNFNPDEARAFIEKFFEGKKEGQTIARSPVRVRPLQEEKRIVLKDVVSTPMVHAAYIAPVARTRDHAIMAVIDAILINGRTSRLNKALVKTGHASSVGAWLDTNIEQGLYYIQCNLKPGADPVEVEKIITNEINNLKFGNISPEEIERAKNRLRADFVRAGDSFTRHAKHLAWYEAIVSCQLFENYLDLVDNVTVSDIRRAAVMYLPENSRVIGLLYPKDSTLPPVDPDEDLFEDLLNIPKMKPEVIEKVNVLPLARKPLAAAVLVSSEEMVAETRDEYREEPQMSHTSDPDPDDAFTVASAGQRAYTVKIDPPKMFEVKYKKHQLSNGVTLLIYENPVNPSVAIQGYARAGSLYESGEKAGLSRLTALMLDYQARPAVGERTELLEQIGANINFDSDLQNAEFNAWCLSRDINRLVPVLSSIFKEPRFNENRFGKVKANMLSHLKTEKKKPASVSNRDFYAEVFPEQHPFSRSPMGTPETLSSLTLEDVEAFFAGCYRPESTIIAISGDVKAPEIIRLFEENLSGWKAEGGIPQVVIPEVKLSPPTDKTVNHLTDTNRVQVVMGHKGIPRYHKDFHKFEVMNYILGKQPRENRLVENLKKAGVAFPIDSNLEHSVAEGPWMIRFGTSGDKVSEAIDIVKNQLKDLQQKTPTGEEIARAQYSLTGRVPVEHQSNKDITRTMLTIEYYNLGEDYLKKRYEAINSIKAEDVSETAKKYLYPDMMIIITEPGK
jgi:zinc protease